MAQAYVDTLAGITDGTVAIPGTLGEIIETVVTVAIGSAFTIGQFGNIGSIALTPGDWLINANVDYTFLTSVTRVTIAVSAFSGNTTTDHVTGSNVLDINLGVTGAVHGNGYIAGFNQNISAATTYFLKGNMAGAVGNQFVGRISARRMR